MVGCLFKLAAFAVMAVAITGPFGPGLRGGGGNPLGALLILVVLVAGSRIAAPTCRRLPPFFIYGCVVSLAGIHCLLPGNNDFPDMPNGPGILWFYITLCSGYVVLTGLACRAAAGLAPDVDPDDARQPIDRCRHCGYSLLGLPEPRCPECGTPFDPRPVRERMENEAYLKWLEEQGP